MAVIITNGQSWDELAEKYTLSPAYGVAIARNSNMEGQSITGKRFRIEIPDNWMKPEYVAVQVTAPPATAGNKNLLWVGAGLLALALLS